MKLSFTNSWGLLELPIHCFPFLINLPYNIHDYIGIPQIGCICLIYPS
nr:MAG TPA: hypothetical protein [Crassvirales sp.]